MDESMMKERYALAKERLGGILTEETVKEPYRDYFQKTAAFLLMLAEVQEKIQGRDWGSLDPEELNEENEKLYQDILPERYGTSYGNPAFAKETLGGTFGPFLSALYSELRGGIVYAFEGQVEFLTILNELFIEVYNSFEQEEPQYQTVRDIFYWYAIDYCEVFAAHRVLEKNTSDQSVPEHD